MILTEKEKQALRSMAVYWDEVRTRTDKSPLDQEARQVFNMIGTRLLGIIKEYIADDSDKYKKCLEYIRSFDFDDIDHDKPPALPG
jgi:hypothetical protein